MHGVLASVSATRPLRDSIREEGVLRRVRSARDRDREGVEPVHRLGPHVELGLVAGGAPARVHEERVVEQRIDRADREQRGREAAEIGVRCRFPPAARAA